MRSISTFTIEGGSTFSFEKGPTLPEDIVVSQECEWASLVGSCERDPRQCDRKTRFVDGIQLHGYTCGGQVVRRVNLKTGVIGQVGRSIHCRDQSV